MAAFWFDVSADTVGASTGRRSRESPQDDKAPLFNYLSYSFISSHMSKRVHSSSRRIFLKQYLQKTVAYERDLFFLNN